MGSVITSLILRLLFSCYKALSGLSGTSYILCLFLFILLMVCVIVFMFYCVGTDVPLNSSPVETVGSVMDDAPSDPGNGGDGAPASFPSNPPVSTSINPWYIACGVVVVLGVLVVLDISLYGGNSYCSHMLGGCKDLIFGATQASDTSEMASVASDHAARGSVSSVSSSVISSATDGAAVEFFSIVNQEAADAASTMFSSGSLTPEAVRMVLRAAKDLGQPEVGFILELLNENPGEVMREFLVSGMEVNRAFGVLDCFVACLEGHSANGTLGVWVPQSLLASLSSSELVDFVGYCMSLGVVLPDFPLS